MCSRVSADGDPWVIFLGSFSENSPKALSNQLKARRCDLRTHLAADVVGSEDEGVCGGHSEGIVRETIGGIDSFLDISALLSEV